jgi:hypothetical protein
VSRAKTTLPFPILTITNPSRRIGTNLTSTNAIVTHSPKVRKADPLRRMPARLFHVKADMISARRGAYLFYLQRILDTTTVNGRNYGNNKASDGIRAPTVIVGLSVSGKRPCPIQVRS